MIHRLVHVALTVVVVIVSSSCSLGADTRPASSNCAGIGAEFGGCDEDLPEFSATECAAVGTEFGAALNDRTTEIIIGPEGEDGESRSVRIRQAMVLLSHLANRYLRETGQHAECDVPEFLAAAEAEFSPELRNSVGGVLFDGEPPANYEDWLQELTRNIGVIDQEE